MTSHLQFLKSDDFKASLGAITSPAALRRHFLLRPDVRALRKTLADGQVTESAIEQFTDELMADFVRGMQFVHEPALAALAVVLESRQSDFAENYLLDLARLGRLSEMDIGPRIAGICLGERRKAAKVIRKVIPPQRSANVISVRGLMVMKLLIVRQAAGQRYSSYAVRRMKLGV